MIQDDWTKPLCIIFFYTDSDSHVQHSIILAYMDPSIHIKGQFNVEWFCCRNHDHASSCSSLSGRNWVRKREDRAQMKLSTIYSQQSKPLLRRKEQQPNVILNHWYKWNPSICRHFWKLLFFSGSKMHSLMNDWMAYMSVEFSRLLNRKTSWAYPRRTF